MKKGRSCYTFQIYCDPNLINKLVLDYLSVNGFSLLQKNGESFYRAGDAMMSGYRYFNYVISGQNLIIYAWFKGMFGEVVVEQNDLNMMAMNYRNSLSILFQEIAKLNGGVTMNNQYQNNSGDNQIGNQSMSYTQSVQNNMQQPIQNNNQQVYSNAVNNQMGYGQNMQNNQGQFVQNFQAETVKKQEKMCEWGFWVSILGLLASFVGVSYSVFIYILDFYFASQGLKTRKRGKAIATIVMSIISIVIIILQIAAA